MALLAMLCAVSLFHAGILQAADENDRRSQAGVRLFRSLLAADMDLSRKTVSDGKLLIAFFYTDSPSRAQEMAAAFAGPGIEQPAIRGMAVGTDVTADALFSSFSGRVPAGIFLAQPPPPDTLRAIIRYGIEHRIIVYSPFEGHVEQGVLGGLAVEAQVRPYVNSETLAASSISLKPFFLKVAKVYP
jgi:hypothetical protein